MIEDVHVDNLPYILKLTRYPENRADAHVGTGSLRSREKIG